MEFNKLVFAGLALGCLGAAAGGSYLATRHNQVSSLEAPVSAAPGAPAPGAPATSAPVTESEGVISPEPSRTPSISSAPTASSRASSSTGDDRAGGASTRADCGTARPDGIHLR